MRVLLDENLDHRLKRFFGEEHAVVSVRKRGWSAARSVVVVLLIGVGIMWAQVYTKTRTKS